MRSGEEQRFEFRIWGNDLSAVAARLEHMAQPGEVRESRETYFVSSTVEANPKARADLLDIKLLVATHAGFQQWRVLLKAEFPVDASLLRDEFFPSLAVPPPPLDRPRYDLAELVKEVVRPHPDVDAVEVAKRRRILEVGSSTGEVTDVPIDGRLLQTVAIESADLTALARVRRDLGLEGHENVSYPLGIRRVVGRPRRASVDR